jgi:hypothetical protein
VICTDRVGIPAPGGRVRATPIVAWGARGVAAQRPEVRAGRRRRRRQAA